MSLLQDQIKKHLEDRGWQKYPPGDFAKSVSIEAAELLENFQWSNPTAQSVKKDAAKLREVSREASDVIIFAIELCVVLGVDYEQAALEKLADAQKKYPVDKVKGGDLKNYWKIKHAHRQKKTGHEDLH